MRLEVRVPLWEMVLPFKSEEADDRESALLRAMWLTPDGRKCYWAVPLPMEVVRILSSNLEITRKWLLDYADDLAALGLEQVERGLKLC